MNLLIDGRPIRNPMSGSAVFVVNLMQALIGSGVNPTVYLQSDRGRNAEIKALDGMALVISSGWRVIENILAEYGLNRNELKNYRESIIHETYFARMPVAGAHKVATIHDVIPLDFPGWFSWRNSYFARKNFLRQIRESKHVVYSSESTRQRALSYYDSDVESSVVHLAASDAIHGAFATYYRLLNSSKLQIPERDYILMVGNIEPRKNIPLVAEALFIINKRLGLDLDLRIAGKANYKDSEILFQAKKALGKDPICMGFVSEQHKINLYQRCACHVYASKYEGFGLPPIEGLLIGAPTVIAQNSSLVEITPDGSMGFNSEDPEDLADALERNLYRSPHMNMNLNMHEIKEYYSWSRVAREYVSIYKALLS